MQPSRSSQTKKRKKSQHFKFVTIGLVTLILAGVLTIVAIRHFSSVKEDLKSGIGTTNKQPDTETTPQQPAPTDDQPRKVTITANGDQLYHDVLYDSAWDGQRYDFDNDYDQIMPLLEKADLALGDFEGTINPDSPLAGYPIFNAPPEVVDSIKKAGYDVLDLAHNHILDTGIAGLISTVDIFKQNGIETIGVATEDDQPFLVKEINGIKIALLAYAYGFNGIESTISQADYDKYLRDLNMDKVAADIKKAEEIADITIVMPQDGVEYALEPTAEQQEKYRQMVDLGADIIFGGHPHVPEPTEIIEKDGQKKFIIYSMGNLLSNQRLETIDSYWGERGVIMEVEITKDQKGTTISNIVPHPTWVSREPIPGCSYQLRGYTFPAYDFQVYLAADYLPGGQYADAVPEEKRQRIETAYHETLQLLNLQW